MSIARFVALISETCRRFAIDVPALSPDAQGDVAVAVQIRDVRVTLACAPRLDLDRIYCFCHLGAIPEDGAPAVLRRLLEANYARGGAADGIFSIDPLTGDAVGEYHLSLATLDSVTLVESVERSVATALAWRDDHFLDEPAPAAPQWRAQEDFA